MGDRAGGTQGRKLRGLLGRDDIDPSPLIYRLIFVLAAVLASGFHIIIRHYCNFAILGTSSLKSAICINKIIIHIIPEQKMSVRVCAVYGINMIYTGRYVVALVMM